MRLLLIRHGQTIDNVRGELGTAIPGPGLTDLGLAQAAAIPGALDGVPIDAIYTTVMVRTQMTAAPLAAARGLDPVVTEGLQEITAGDLEGRSDKEAVKTYLTTLFAWWTDFGARIPGGEDGNEFYARYNGAIDAIRERHPDGTVVVVSHGAAIRTWAAWSSENLDAEFSRTHVLENTGMVTLESTEGGGWITTDWNADPIGGAALDDQGAPDPTGEGVA